MSETPSPRIIVGKRNLLPLGLIIVFGIFASTLPQPLVLDAIKEMRQKEPHLTFVLAWNRLMQKQPELFDFEEA